MQIDFAGVRFMSEYDRKAPRVAIVFLGRPYEDGNMIKLAYAYEQATHHRRPPTNLE